MQRYCAVSITKKRFRDATAQSFSTCTQGLKASRVDAATRMQSPAGKSYHKVFWLRLTSDFQKLQWNKVDLQLTQDILNRNMWAPWKEHLCCASAALWNAGCLSTSPMWINKYINFQIPEISRTVLILANSCLLWQAWPILRIIQITYFLMFYFFHAHKPTELPFSLSST